MIAKYRLLRTSDYSITRYTGDVGPKQSAPQCTLVNVQRNDVRSSINDVESSCIDAALIRITCLIIDGNLEESEV